jgi:hypothetical protein
MQFPRLVTAWRNLSLQATAAVEDQPGAFRVTQARGARLSSLSTSGQEHLGLAAPRRAHSDWWAFG